MARGGSASRGAYGALGLAAKVVDVLTAVVAVVIVTAILLVVLEANRRNDIVTAVRDVAGFLVGPFDALFTFEKRKTEIAVNYAIAAAVYVVVGRVVASLLRRPAA